MTDLKKNITKIVVSELNARVSRKSSGTKVGTNTRVIPTTVVKPFSK